jgi:hypothetical protein
VATELAQLERATAELASYFGVAGSSGGGASAGTSAESKASLECMLGTLHRFCGLLASAHSENLAEEAALVGDHVQCTQ